MIIGLIQLMAFVVALTVHEFSHALVGYLLGDETARRMGRLTLNPVPHIDPIGTVIVPLVGMFTGFPVIGWAKPVPFNPYNLKYHKWGSVMVALAGPTSNFVLAAVFTLVLRAVLVGLGLPLTNLLVIFLAWLIGINVVLGLFNFLPVPPLDGSKLLHAVLDHPKYRNFLLFMETKGPLILLLIIFLDFGSPRSIIGGAMSGAINAFWGLAGLL